MILEQSALIKLKALQYIKHLQWSHSLTFDEIIEGVSSCDTVDELREFFLPISKTKIYNVRTPINEEPVFSCLKVKNNLSDLNMARDFMGKSHYQLEPVISERNKL